MCRFIIRSTRKGKDGKYYLTIEDTHTDVHWHYEEPLWKYRMKREFYKKHGIAKGEQYE